MDRRTKAYPPRSLPSASSSSSVADSLDAPATWWTGHSFIGNRQHAPALRNVHRLNDWGADILRDSGCSFFFRPHPHLRPCRRAVASSAPASPTASRASSSSPRHRPRERERAGSGSVDRQRPAFTRLFVASSDRSSVERSLLPIVGEGLPSTCKTSSCDWPSTPCATWCSASTPEAVDETMAALILRRGGSGVGRNRPIRFVAKSIADKKKQSRSQLEVEEKKEADLLSSYIEGDEEEKRRTVFDSFSAARSWTLC